MKTCFNNKKKVHRHRAAKTCGPSTRLLQIIRTTKHFCWWNLFNKMWSSWSWFDV